MQQKITLDAEQLALQKRLAKLNRDILEQQKNRGFFANFFAKLAKIFGSNFVEQINLHKPRSLYIYGDVGRGKSMLMREFFEKLPLKNKLYFHFNNFMQQLHAELHKLRSGPQSREDLVARATQKIIGENLVLCFDEMQVEDVADALLLQRIFSDLFARGIVIIFTSNCHPEELYLQGLQREAFLEFVRTTLYPNSKIINLDGGIDYRSAYLQSLKKHYFTPINSRNLQELQKIFAEATNHEKPHPTRLEVLRRELFVKKTYHNIAWFDFAELCAKELGVADYQAICRKFRTIFLVNIPQLKAEDRNEAKRLMLFIDEAYEHHNNLLILAAVPPGEIYPDGTGAKAFKRTASRLNQLTNSNSG